MANETDPEILLGFCEKVDSWELHRAYFRPKVGGFPAWLNPDQTPKVLCPFCQQSMMLLVQAYAEKEPVHAYHRVIYVFTCRNGACHQASIETENAKLPYRVFRCQLPQKNNYYEMEPTGNYDTDKNVMIRADKKLAKDFCFNCGQVAGARCKDCGSVAYCGRTCQVNHWKTGHKKVCKTIKQKPSKNFIYPTKRSSWTFDEYELIIEPEPSEEDEEDRIERDNQRIMDEIAENDGSEFSDTELEQATGGPRLATDKQFQKFQKRVNREPEQVLRYIQDDVRKASAGALHISSEGVQQAQNKPPPPCSLCTGERLLEFQVMPQILNKLNADKNPIRNRSLHETLQDRLNLADSNFGVDFGVLNVYTCKCSCKIDRNGY